MQSNTLLTTDSAGNGQDTIQKVPLVQMASIDVQITIHVTSLRYEIFNALESYSMETPMSLVVDIAELL